jgi:hypothetical protein
MNAYIISVDNDCSWEDHHVDLICVIPTKEDAEEKVAQWTAWAAKLREKVPAEFEWPQTDDEMENDKAYDAYMVVYNAFKESLKPPHGFTGLNDMVWGDRHHQPFLKITEIPYLA